jgi:hypothetical protein
LCFGERRSGCVPVERISNVPDQARAALMKRRLHRMGENGVPVKRLHAGDPGRHNHKGLCRRFSAFVMLLTPQSRVGRDLRHQTSHRVKRPLPPHLSPNAPQWGRPGTIWPIHGRHLDGQHLDDCKLLEQALLKSRRLNMGNRHSQAFRRRRFSPRVREAATSSV